MRSKAVPEAEPTPSPPSARRQETGGGARRCAAQRPPSATKQQSAAGRNVRQARLPARMPPSIVARMPLPERQPHQLQGRPSFSACVPLSFMSEVLSRRYITSEEGSGAVAVAQHECRETRPPPLTKCVGQPSVSSRPCPSEQRPHQQSLHVQRPVTFYSKTSMLVAQKVVMSTPRR